MAVLVALSPARSASDNEESATLEPRLEAHMTDVISTHEETLSRLNDHLHEQRYHLGTARHCMSAARHFLAYLRKRRIAIDDAQPETVEHYLKLVQRKYRRRHGHSPAYDGWRCIQTNGIHMLLRMVRGQWPPAAVAVTPFELSRRDLCDGYAKSMVEMRGLSAESRENQTSQERGDLMTHAR